MIKAQKKTAGVDRLEHGSIIMPVIGHIACPEKSGEVMVEIKGDNPKNARLVYGINRTELIKPDSIGREVLIVFEKGDPDLPIIVALMENPLEDILSVELQEDSRKRSDDILIDGKSITIEAKDEIILKCGKGSIIINKDGKITVKGTHVLSRSSGPNKIKGASVNIN